MTHANMVSRVIGIVAIAVAASWLQPTAAYGEAAEGAVINNIATVTYNAGNDLDADLTGTLVPAARRLFWVRVQVN